MDWTAIVTAFLGVIGGGGGVWVGVSNYYRYKIDKTAQGATHQKDHQTFLNQQSQELLTSVQTELMRERKRAAKIEDMLEEVRQELAREYAKDINAQAEVNRLKEEIARLRGHPS